VSRKNVVGKRSGRSLFQGLKQLEKGGISLFVGYLGNVIGFPVSLFSHYLLKQASRLKEEKAKGSSKETSVSKRHVNYLNMSGQTHNC